MAHCCVRLEMNLMSSQAYQLLFLTERSPHHQQAALEAAPAAVAVTMLRTPDRATILARLPQMDFLISERAGAIDAEMIAAGHRLQLIQRLGSLTYDIDVAAARARGIPVCTWPIEGCILVAEHLVMQMLALVKRLVEAQAMTTAAIDWGRPAHRTDENTFAYNWTNRSNIDGLYQKTVGILGFGEIGAELARCLRGFRPAQVLYHKRRRLPVTVEAELGITYGTEETLFAQSDFLCNLLPYSAETELHLNRAVFQQMRRGAFLVSCGSGGTVHEADLVAALQAGHLGGAALDTYEWEPLPANHPLVQLARENRANLLLTPHIAFGVRSKDQVAWRSDDYTNILRWLAKEPLLHEVK
ncbi:MAG: hypothetical protein DYG89_17885 [Caldilinea sp. CFX5]|nr:hypothetical protein [Caldilinea sp. CFX5]